MGDLGEIPIAASFTRPKSGGRVLRLFLDCPAKWLAQKRRTMTSRISKSRSLPGKKTLLPGMKANTRWSSLGSCSSVCIQVCAITFPER